MSNRRKGIEVRKSLEEKFDFEILKHGSTLDEKSLIRKDGLKYRRKLKGMNVIENLSKYGIVEEDYWKRDFMDMKFKNLEGLNSRTYLVITKDNRVILFKDLMALNTYGVGRTLRYFKSIEEVLEIVFIFLKSVFGVEKNGMKSFTFDPKDLRSIEELIVNFIGESR